MTKGEGIVLSKQQRCKYKKSQALRMTEGKRNVNMGSIQKETKCIGPSLRAIDLRSGNTVQALAQDDKKGEGIVLSKQQRCNCKKVTGSQDDKRGEGIVLTKQPRCKYKKS